MIFQEKLDRLECERVGRAKKQAAEEEWQNKIDMSSFTSDDDILDKIIEAVEHSQAPEVEKEIMIYSVECWQSMAYNEGVYTIWPYD